MGQLQGGLCRSAADDFACDLVERQDFLRQSGARHKPGHPPDDARGLVLDENGPAGAMNGARAFGAVGAHTGEDDAEHRAGGRALFERQHTGTGRWVHTSLLEAQIFMLDFQASRWLISQEIAPQAGNDHPTGIPTGVFPVSDGHINIAASSA